MSNNTALSPARRTALVIGATIGVLLIAYGAFVGVSLLTPERSSEHRQEFGASVKRISIDVGSGDVRLRRSDTNAVQVQRTVQAGWREPDIEERAGADGVVIRADCPDFFTFRCEVDYDIAIPDGFTIEARASSGELAMRGVSSRTVRAEVSSGDVELINVSGAVDLDASSGTLTAQRMRSERLTAQVSSGDVLLDFAEPPRQVDVEASSGTVELGLPTGSGAYQVDTETSSGEEQVDVPVDPSATRTIDVRASSGDVTVLPR